MRTRARNPWRPARARSDSQEARLVSESGFTPGLTLATGHKDDAYEWIGETGVTQFATEAVNAPMIRLYVSMIEDSTPVYWQQCLADRIWGGIPAPPGMLTVWRRPLLWTPGERPAEERELFAEIPFPAEKDTILTVSVETTFDRQIVEGDWLNCRDEIVNITEEKETQLGGGHFITTETIFRDHRGETVATNTKTIFRYAAEPTANTADTRGPFARGRRNVTVEESPGRVGALSLESLSAGDSVPSYRFGVSYQDVIYDVAATRDFYPGHNDPEFARAQGNETIFLNNIAFQGLVDRLALEWAGPEWRVHKRDVQIQGAAAAGSRLTVEGTVESIDSDRGNVSIEIGGRVRKEGTENICPFSVTIVNEWS